ncbi:MAG: hypothetical protein SPL30_10790 [Succinivibrio sp.]|jgi:hypothetical protein|nr:hypothetical protein [Succinivibrio sp.]
MAGNGAVLKEQEKLPKMPEVLQKKAVIATGEAVEDRAKGEKKAAWRPLF